MRDLPPFPNALLRTAGLCALLLTACGAPSHKPLTIAINAGVEGTALKTAALTWGAIVAAGILVSALTGLLGLAVVFPVLGHGTWHAYRAMC